MTPREVRRRYSKGRVLDVVLRKGYKKRGICAREDAGCHDKLDGGVCVGALPLRKSCLVSGWEATHWRRASALQTRLETWAVRLGGESNG